MEKAGQGILEGRENPPVISLEFLSSKGQSKNL
jgi:hypothetical protein